MQKDDPPLGAGASDHIAAFVRAGIGTLPVVGPAFTELVNLTIPGVRQNRVENYLKFLQSKVSEISEEQLKVKLKSDIAIDLVEEGAFLAVRALSDERRDQITSVVANGLNGDQQELIEAKRMLQLLRELDEAQVILLSSKLMKNYRDDQFRTKHESVLKTVQAHMQSSREELDRSVVQGIGEQKLISLGLIKRRYAKIKKGEMPEFDEKSGTLKSAGIELTSLGRLLLRRLGLADEDDQ